MPNREKELIPKVPLVCSQLTVGDDIGLTILLITLLIPLVLMLCRTPHGYENFLHEKWS